MVLSLKPNAPLFASNIVPQYSQSSYAIEAGMMARQHLKVRDFFALHPRPGDTARAVVKAIASRRRFLRFGLFAAGGAVAAKQGIGNSARADATLNIDDGIAPSPLSVPFSADLPQAQLAVKTPAYDVTNPDNPVGRQLSPAPDGFSWTHGATVRTPHQLFSVDAAGRFGPGPNGDYRPQRFYQLVVQEASHNFSPGTPGWGASKVWGFDGKFPGPLFREKYGVPILVRYLNQLPSVSIPQPFGISNITTHLHNGHTATESDGHPLDIFPSVATQNDPAVRILNRNGGPNNLGFRDHHYPNQYAGFASIKKGSANGSKIADGDPNEALGSLWYHDHSIGFTAANVYRGLAGFYNLFDDLDTGDESMGLHLPSGDHDVPIIFLDVAFGPDFQPVFDNFNTDGILGDKFTANGIIQPKFPVAQRRHRLRLYNIGPSRFYEFWITDGNNFISKPFWQISSDGNLLPAAIKVDSIRTAVAERIDVVVDFAALAKLYPGKPLYLVNRLEQVNGRGPTGKLLPVGQAVQIIRFDIGAPPPPDQKDMSVDFSAANADLALRPLPRLPDFAALTRRTFRFERGNGAWQVNGKFYEFDADFNAVGGTILPAASAAAGEIWTIQNGGGGWAHPMHPHFEELRILKIDGRAPPAALAGRKDIVPLGPTDEFEVFVRFRDLAGRYVMHCHNVVHEDHAMMVDLDIVKGAAS